jgi:hypothetical protein
MRDGSPWRAEAKRMMDRWGRDPIASGVDVLEDILQLCAQAEADGARRAREAMRQEARRDSWGRVQHTDGRTWWVAHEDSAAEREKCEVCKSDAQAPGGDIPAAEEERA